MATENDGAPPLRGDAAWRAAKEQIAERNDAARARGREERSAADEIAKRRRDAAARREMTDLPVQPEP